MSAKFKFNFLYKQLKVNPFPSSKRSINLYRPIIPIIIIYKTKLVQFEALIDSGADYNIFHGDIAAYLGIKLTSGSRRNITGISGNKLKGYEHKVTMQTESHQFQTTITFSNQLPENSLAVLGNKGFFDKFNVNFNLRDGLISLTL